MEDCNPEGIKMSIEADEMAISAKLRSLRVGACIDINEFAEALGVEAAELESYESGVENVPASVIAMACSIFGIPYEYFFGEEAREDDFPVEISLSACEEQPAILS